MRRRVFYCKHCGSHEGYASRPRNFFEKHTLPLLQLRPVRCRHCNHRFYTSIAVAVSERAEAIRRGAA
jgi:hypothetical protein